MKPYQSSPNALKDVRANANRIKKDNRIAAERFLTAYEQTCGMLSHNPSLGTKYTIANAALKNLRVVPLKGFSNYRIFYIEYPSKIIIIRIFHAARDTPPLLEST